MTLNGSEYMCDWSGRKLTVAVKSGVLIDASGTATHTALVRVSDSTLKQGLFYLKQRTIN